MPGDRSRPANENRVPSMSVTTADFSGLCFGVEPPEPMARLLLPMARSKIGCMATAREPPGAGECAGNYWDLFQPSLSLCLPTRPGAGPGACVAEAPRRSNSDEIHVHDGPTPEGTPRRPKELRCRSAVARKTPSPQRLCSTPSVRRPWLLRAARLRPEYGHGHPHASCIAHEPRSGAASSTLARCSLGSPSLLEGIFSSALVAALLAG